MTAVLGWLRGLFAVALLAGFYVVAFGLLAADTALVGLMLWGMIEFPSRANNWWLALAASIPAASALLYGIATVSRTEEPPPDAVLLRRADAPGLWRLVEDLAGQLRTRPPGRIYLTSEANASVSEDARMLGFAVGERTMYLGVPLLLRLRPMELRAVLCHELGHYAGRHTRFGAIAYRGAASLHSTLFRLRMTARSENALGYAWLFQAAIGAYAWMYLRLSLAVRRRQELEADAEAAAAVGPEVTAQALRAVHALGITWAGFESRFLRPVQRLGFVPEDVFEAFAAMVGDPLVRKRMADLRAHPVEAGRSPLDSHPPLARRLALIEARPATSPRTVVDDEGPLVADPSPVPRVQRKMLGEAGHTATALPWTDWADLAAEAFAIELASLLLDAARDPDVAARPTLATVLGLLERGRQTELVRGLTDAPHPEEQLTEALYALTGQALAGAGRARWVLSWTQGYLLDCPRDPRGRLDDLVAAAARDRTAVSALRGELVRLGVDIEAPVVLALRTVAAPAGPTTARRSTRNASNLVVEELARQRKVAKVTMGALIVAGVVWGIALIGSDSSQPYQTFPQTYRTAQPTPIFPQYSALPPYTDLLPEPSFTPRLPTPVFTDLFSPPPLELYFGFHDVVPGDTLSGLACEYGTTVENLQELNDMGKRTDLSAGQRLLVPTREQGSGNGAADCR